MGRPKHPQSAAPLSVPRSVKPTCFYILDRVYLILVPSEGVPGPKDQSDLKSETSVGAMLALLFALGPFLGALGPLLHVSWLLVGVHGWFCRVRERSGVDCGGFGTLAGMFFELLTVISVF